MLGDHRSAISSFQTKIREKIIYVFLFIYLFLPNVCMDSWLYKSEQDQDGIFKSRENIPCKQEVVF